jgi:hypothetical protein
MDQLVVRVAQGVGIHALLIVVPCIFYVFISAALAVAVSGKQRVETLSSIGIIFAFALLGVILGFFTGNSKSAVVQALLPALLTFTAGMAAYLGAKDSRAAWREILPFGMVSMLLAVLFSVSHGLALKQISAEAERDAEEARLEFEKVHLEVRRQAALKELGLSVPPSSAASAKATEK